jgi:hypothetical protein
MLPKVLAPTSPKAAASGAAPMPKESKIKIATRMVTPFLFR